MTSPWITEFSKESIHRMQLNTPRIEACLGRLTEEEVWQRPNNASNSMGNLLLHLCGNIRQYIISGLGRQPDSRTRDAEFSATGGLLKQELLQRLKDTVQEAEEVIRSANETALLTTIQVQGYELTGIGIIIHVVEHYSYHTGQIAFWTKQLRNEDLGFYAGVNLNIKNAD
ncbi:DinB family protein [Arundinibacter roseus]|uniref:DUF1572 domain-containing protein n=1 Tax=Arundinibacter roseus TaxID=2070510 RepID=A0A4R4KFU5_9BACT|nr:DinB family protein [Arundinibacter roseus]TDB66867.1 DUF1572 domain-containing protein [Arundinibacter roseus]